MFIFVHCSMSSCIQGSLFKTRFSMMLSEARSNFAADRSEVKAKEFQKIDLEKAYLAFKKLCCERVKWIMFQDMCALIVVRNAAMESSTTCPGTEIVDCDRMR